MKRVGDRTKSITVNARPVPVYVVRGTSGGWDVVIRVDGTYSQYEMAEEVAEELRCHLEFLTEDRLYWGRG